jgi:hypothetical protein
VYASKFINPAYLIMKKAPQLEVSPPSRRMADQEMVSPQVSSGESHQGRKRKHIELSPFNVPLHSKSPLQTTSYDVLLPTQDDVMKVYKTHAEDGFTLKSRKSEKF